MQKEMIKKSFEDFELLDCLKEKLGMLIKDEADLPKPVLITLVIPTKIDVGKKTRKLELNVMRRILSECSRLVDMGYLDEIIVVDGSLDEEENPDYSVLSKVVARAYEKLDLFQRQVNLINENKAEGIDAKLGFFDFIVKTVHQLDRNVWHVLDKYGVGSLARLQEPPMGKGAALWLSIPIAKGDIICFIDSDIMNFKKEFIVALCHPIVQTWHKHLNSIKMSKAFYRRLTMSLDVLGRSYIFGGRVTRLFAIPMLKVLAKKFPSVFKNFDLFEYPLAGEFAIRKELLEELSFPNDYSIEFSILKQVLSKVGLSSIAQIDLRVFYHIGQSHKGLTKMISQIMNQIVDTFKKNNLSLSKKDKKAILADYKRTINKLLSHYERIFDSLMKQMPSRIKQKVVHSKSIDIKRFNEFYNVLERILNSESKIEQKILPSWKEVAQELNYFAITTMLRRRANQSTLNRLKEAGLFLS
jgi:hypothetical protein